jgi:hypothetical protein
VSDGGPAGECLGSNPCRYVIRYVSNHVNMQSIFPSSTCSSSWKIDVYLPTYLPTYCSIYGDRCEREPYNPTHLKLVVSRRWDGEIDPTAPID